MNSRSEAQKRAYENAEELAACEAATKGEEDLAAGSDDDQHPAKRSRQTLGLQKTKLLNTISTSLQKLEDLKADITKDKSLVIEKIKEIYADEEGQLPPANLEMSNDVKAKCEQAITTISDTFMPQWVALQTSAEKATSTGDVRQVGIDIKDAAKPSEHADIKAAKELLAGTKRHNTKEANKKQKGKDAGERGAAVVSAPVSCPAHAVLVALAEKLVQPFNIALSLHEAKLGLRAAVVNAGKNRKGEFLFPKEDIKKNFHVKGIIKNCKARNQKTGSTMVAGPMTDVSKMAKVQKILKSAFDPHTQTKLLLPQEEWASRVYAPEIFVTEPGHQYTFPTNNATCEARLYLEGFDCVMGVPYEAVQGQTLRDKRQYLNSLPIDRLEQLMKDSKGFLTKTNEPDKLYMFPSGFLLVNASNGSTCIRWGVSADDTDTQRVRLMAHNIIQSHPEFANGSQALGPFLGWLNSQAPA